MHRIGTVGCGGISGVHAKVPGGMDNAVLTARPYTASKASVLPGLRSQLPTPPAVSRCHYTDRFERLLTQASRMTSQSSGYFIG